MNIGYLRVSSISQDTDAQKTVVLEYCQKNNIQIDQWLEITISSKKSMAKRGITELLDNLKKNDCLIVSELSRLGRSIMELSFIIDQLTKKRIRLIAIKQSININYENGNGGLDMASKVLINCFSLMAEIERDTISERTRYGQALAKQKGVIFGNPKIHELNFERGRKSIPYKEELKNIVGNWIAERYNQRQIMEKLNNLNISTLTGKGKWSLVQVQRLLKDCNLKTIRTRKEK